MSEGRILPLFIRRDVYGMICCSYKISQNGGLFIGEFIEEICEYLIHLPNDEVDRIGGIPHLFHGFCLIIVLRCLIFIGREA